MVLQRGQRSIPKVTALLHVFRLVALALITRELYASGTWLVTHIIADFLRLDLLALITQSLAYLL